MKIWQGFGNFSDTCTGRVIVAAAVWWTHGPSFVIGTLRMLWVAVVGPYTRKVVAPSHRWGQQRVPRVGAARMRSTIALDVGIEAALVQISFSGLGVLQWLPNACRACGTTHPSSHKLCNNFCAT